MPCKKGTRIFFFKITLFNADYPLYNLMTDKMSIKVQSNATNNAFDISVSERAIVILCETSSVM